MPICILTEKDGQPNWCSRHGFHNGHYATYARDPGPKGERFRQLWDDQLRQAALAQVIPPDKPLSALQKARNYVKAVAAHALAGRKKIPLEVQQARRAICDPCRYRDTAKDTCKACGCPLQATAWGDKLGWASSACPKGFWGVYQPALPTLPYGSTHESPVGTIGVYVLAIPKRFNELKQTLARWAKTDWPTKPIVIMQDPETPVATLKDRWIATAQNSYNLIKRMYDDNCDYGLFTEDDIEPNLHLYHNLMNWAPLRWHRLHMAALYMPDTIITPYKPTVYERPSHNYAIVIPDLNYRIPRPLNGRYPKGNYWGSQCYIFSRWFMERLLEHWNDLRGGQDSRSIKIAKRNNVSIVYHWPDLVEHHHPAAGSNFNSPGHKSPDFSSTWRAETLADLNFPHKLTGDLTAAEALTLLRWCRGTKCRLLGENDKIKDVLRQGNCDSTDRQIYDLIVIDGKKDKESVLEDIRFAMHRIGPNGLLAFRCYGMHDNQGVTAAADAIATQHLWRLVDRAESLAIFKVN